MPNPSDFLEVQTKLRHVKVIPIDTGLTGEKHLAQWLNGDWQLPDYWVNGVGTNLPTLTPRKHAAARTYITEVFLPILREASKNISQTDWRKGETDGELVMRVRTLPESILKTVRLRLALTRYPLLAWPDLHSAHPSSAVSTAKQGEGFTMLVAAGRKPIESWAAHTLLKMAQTGRLERLRKCRLEGCKRYFFARRIDGHFCGEICRVKVFQTSEEYKKTHAMAMRKARMENKKRLERQDHHGKT